MTREDFQDLVDVMAGREVTSHSLVQELLAQKRRADEAEIALAKLERAQYQLKRAAMGRPAVRELEESLRAKQAALNFAIRRNEILRSELAQASGGDIRRRRRRTAA